MNAPKHRTFNTKLHLLPVAPARGLPLTSDSCSHERKVTPKLSSILNGKNGKETIEEKTRWSVYECIMINKDK